MTGLGCQYMGLERSDTNNLDLVILDHVILGLLYPKL